MEPRTHKERRGRNDWKLRCVAFANMPKRFHQTDIRYARQLHVSKRNTVYQRVSRSAVGLIHFFSPSDKEEKKVMERAPITLISHCVHVPTDRSALAEPCPIQGGAHSCTRTQYTHFCSPKINMEYSSIHLFHVPRCITSEESLSGHDGITNPHSTVRYALKHGTQGVSKSKQAYSMDRMMMITTFQDDLRSWRSLRLRRRISKIGSS